MIVLNRADDRPRFARGGFVIRRNFPGRGLGIPGEGGLGPLGAVDHSTLTPGEVIPMHEHRNDEILSYMVRGEMRHLDTAGGRVSITPTRLAVMHAGRGMRHEERVPEAGDGRSEAVDMLQIFVRPRAEDLEPAFEHAEVAASPGPAWRAVAAPDDDPGAAPVAFRNRVWIEDIDARPGPLAIPARPGLDRWLVVFSGAVRLGGPELRPGDSVTMVDEPGETPAEIVEPARLVLFHVDRSAPYTRAGTLSG